MRPSPECATVGCGCGVWASRGKLWNVQPWVVGACLWGASFSCEIFFCIKYKKIQWVIEKLYTFSKNVLQ